MLENQEAHDIGQTGNGETISVYATMVRAIAITAVVSHNFLLVMPYQKNSLPGTFLWQFTEALGTFVQLFFILSGYGLATAYLSRPLKWSVWARRRFVKIVVPYWIAVILTFAAAKLSQMLMPGGGQESFSLLTLAVYLAFLQNVISTGTSLNLALWFMPVIVGLYLLFPLLMSALKKYGAPGLVGISLLIGNGSVAACVFLDYPINNLHALPFFFVDEFAFGILFAFIVKEHAHVLERMARFDFVCLGVGLYGLSWSITAYSLLGEGSGAYNDIFTTIGLWLVLLVVFRWTKEAVSERIKTVFETVSLSAYAMYLLHKPVLDYLIEPCLQYLPQKVIHVVWLIPLAIAFAALIFCIVEGGTLMARQCEMHRANN